MSYLVYVDTLLLLGSIGLFTLGVVEGKRQIFGLFLAVLALLLEVLYYGDIRPFSYLHFRSIIGFVDLIDDGHKDFRSSLAPAILIVLLYLIRILVFQRVAVRQRLAHISSKIATFLAGAAVVVLTGSLLDSVFSWGWVGALVISIIFTAIYLATLGIFGSLFELTIEIAKLAKIWTKRKIQGIATSIARAVQWLASLPGYLVPRLKRWIAHIRRASREQETKFHMEQERGDEKLLAAARARETAREDRDWE